MNTKNTILAIDTETTGLNWFKNDRPFLILWWNGNEEESPDYIIGEVSPYTRQVYWQGEDLAEFQILIDNAELLVFHNAPFDIHMLEQVGIKITTPFVDTMILTHTWNNSLSSYGLKFLAEKFCNIDTEDENELKMSTRSARRDNKKLGYLLADDVEADYWMADPLLVIKYGKKDVIRTHKLWQWLMNISGEDKNLANIRKMEMECCQALVDMERIGVSVDIQKAKELEKYYEGIIEECLEIKTALGFEELNTNSPKQMIEAFYNVLQAPIQFATRKKSDGLKVKTASVDKHALKKLAPEYPLAKCLMRLNSADDELNKFIKPLQVLADENNAVHPNYRQCGAVTGRLSCSNPNLQNITNTSTTSEGVDKRARELFIPREGCVLYFPDYSQIEVWIAAFASQDKVMMDYLINGHDLHGELNKQFFGHRPDFEEHKGQYRKKIKGLTFATIYGAGAYQLSEMGLGIDMEESKEFIHKFYAKYSGLKAYKEALIRCADTLGYIEDNFGRRYYIDTNESFKSLNYMIQGSASGVMKRAIVNVGNLCKNYLGMKLLLTIHDELCIEVPRKFDTKKTMKEIIRAMQGDFHTYFGMPKPFDVSMARTETNWAEKEEIAI